MVYDPLLLLMMIALVYLLPIPLACQPGAQVEASEEREEGSTAILRVPDNCRFGVALLQGSAKTKSDERGHEKSKLQSTVGLSIQQLASSENQQAARKERQQTCFFQAPHASSKVELTCSLPFSLYKNTNNPLASRFGHGHVELHSIYLVRYITRYLSRGGFLFHTV